MSGYSPYDRLVELAHEVDRLEVLAAAVLVGDPLAVLARVVEVQHRGDGVDPQPVDVVAVEPAHRARHQERAHLVAAVVEDRRVPVGVVALPRIGVLVQVRAVELVQAVGVGGEVRRHPVEDHADAALVELVDHRHQVGRRAVARRRREVAGGLVPPRSVERVLHDREELDVREPVRQAMLGERDRRARGSSGSADPRRACDPTIRGGPRRSTSARRAPAWRRAPPSTRRRPTRARGRSITESIDGGR